MVFLVAIDRSNGLNVISTHCDLNLWIDIKILFHFTEKAGDEKLTEMKTLDFVVSYNLNLV